mgnify:CR=1 FL=1
MAGVIFSLCTATALLCAGLLLRSYRRTRSRLLLWSGLCFVGLSLSNLLLVIDRLIAPSIDLSMARLLTALLGMLLLLYGLIWEAE